MKGEKFTMSKTKSLSAIFAFVFMFLFASCFVACGETKDEVVSISIKAGTFQDVAQKDSTYDTSNIEVWAKYAKQSEAKLDNNKVTFSIDTSKIGEQKLVVTLNENTKITTSETVKIYGDLQEIKLVLGSYKTKVIEENLDKYDTQTLKILACYEFTGSEQIEITKDSGFTATFNKQTTEEGGKKYATLTATFGEKSVSAKIEVVKNEIVGIEVDNTTVPTEVNKDDTIDWSKVKVYGIRSDDERILLTKDATDFGYTINAAFNTQSAGEKELVFTYNESFNTITYYVKVFGAVTGVSIDESTVPKSVTQNKEFDTSKIKVVVTFEGYDRDGNDLSKTFQNNKDVAFSEIDTSTIGEKSLTATYKNVTSSAVTLNVYASEKGTLSQDANYEKFLSNSKQKNTYTETNGTGTKGFVATENAKYYVGTDNEFKYSPILQTFDTTTQKIVEKTEFLADIKVEKVNGDNTTDVSNDSGIVVFDKYKHTFEFKESAEGSEFKITVTVGGSSSKSINVVVTDGYNVQTVAQLSVFDNVNAGGKWTTYKEQNGLTNVSANKLILHSNLTITENDIPSFHIWTQDEVTAQSQDNKLVGALKNYDVNYHSANEVKDITTPISMNSDGKDLKQVLGIVYRRAVNADETFCFEGNFFQIDASSLPLMRNEEKDAYSEENFLALTGLFGCEAWTTKTEYTTEKMIVQNIALLGNVQKTEETDGRGGIIGFKDCNIESHFENVFTQQWYVSVMTRGADDDFSENDITPEDEATLQTSTYFNNVSAFDNFNCLIYLQGNGKTEINNSVMIGAGGPVMIVDHAKKTDSSEASTGRPVFVYENNSIFESYVTGGEAWFVGYGAQGYAGTILSANQLFTPYGYSFVNTTHDTTSGKDISRMNIVAVFKADSLDFAGNSIRGIFKDESNSDYVEMNASQTETIKIVSNKAYGMIYNYLKNGSGTTGEISAYTGLVASYKQQNTSATDEKAQAYAEQTIKQIAKGYADGFAATVITQAPVFQTQNGEVMIMGSSGWLSYEFNFKDQLKDLATGLGKSEDYFAFNCSFAPTSAIGQNPPSLLNLYFSGMGIVLGGFKCTPAS